MIVLFLLLLSLLLCVCFKNETIDRIKMEKLRNRDENKTDILKEQKIECNVMLSINWTNR